MDADQADLLQLRAAAKLKLDDPSQTIADATRAIELGHDTWEVRRLRAQAHAALKHWNEASVDCQAVPTGDDDQNFDIVRAYVAAELGQVASASEALARAHYGQFMGNEEVEVCKLTLRSQQQAGNWGVVLLLATRLARDPDFGDEAPASVRNALRHFESLLQTEPQDSLARRYVVLARIGLAEHYTAAGRRKEAIDSLEPDAPLAELLDRTSNDDAYVLKRLAIAWDTLGDEAYKANEGDSAEASYHAAERWYKMLAATAPDNSDTSRRLAWTYVSLGNCRLKASRVQEAMAFFQQATMIWDQLVATAPENREYLHGQWYCARKLCPGFTIGRKAGRSPAIDPPGSNHRPAGGFVACGPRVRGPQARVLPVQAIGLFVVGSG